jgi:hypothetical protein
MFNPTACQNVTATLSLTPVGGGAQISGNATPGNGGSPTTLEGFDFYYDCNFAPNLSDVPAGNYTATILLADNSSPSQVGYILTSDSGISLDIVSSTELAISVTDSITVSGGSATTVGPLLLFVGT